MLDQILILAILLFFPAAMAFAAASDLVTMTISNKISITLVAGFFILALWTGMGIEQFGWHVLSGLVVLAAGFAFFAFGWIGGGDAKLLAVTSLWFGFSVQMAEYLFVATLFGGVLTLLMLAYRHYPLPNIFSGQDWALRLHHNDEGVPYGMALAAGALFVYPDTWWMTEALGYAIQ